MAKRIAIPMIIFFTMSVSFLVARSFRVNQIPNGDNFGCVNCHVSPAGGGSKNAFGNIVGASFLSSPGASGNVEWGAQLAALDSDGDGFSNGVELQDPNGTWRIGQPQPGNSSLVTNPGDPTSKPNVSGLGDEEITADKYVLHNNYPNPFNPETNISFTIPESGFTELSIYNIQGQKIVDLISSELSAGNYRFSWNGRNSGGAQMSSGIYIYRLSSGNVSIAKEMILMK